MRVVATKVKGRELLPGDLFSVRGPDYWDHYDRLSVGQKVWLRTEASADLFEDADEDVYRISVAFTPEEESVIVQRLLEEAGLVTLEELDEPKAELEAEQTESPFTTWRDSRSELEEGLDD